jgi:hypothetical protein
MTERKPPGVTWESWIDRQIREGMERGEFDNLSGVGKPLPGIDGTRDDDWWLKATLRREELSFLPPTLAVRKELDESLAAIDRATDESAVRQIVAAINERIRTVNSTATSGPATSLMPLDLDAVVSRWRANQQSRPADES